MHIAISYDFLPKIGGAHQWLYEVYNRWPTPVTLLTRVGVTEGERREQQQFDRNDHGALRILRAVRRDTSSVTNPGSVIEIARLSGLIRRMHDGRGAVIHALRAFPEGFLGAIGRVTSGRKCTLVTYAHGEEILIAQTSRQLSMMARFAYGASDLIVANSESTRRLVATLVPAANVVCVNPGVDPTAFERSSQEKLDYRRRWNWPPDTVIVCTVARMEPRKNHAGVIDAVAALRRRGLPVAYVCAGDGEQLGALRARAREHSLEQWVAFPGAVSNEEKQLIFASSDIHAMPSVQLGEMLEGYGIVFLEAAAAGIPSISGNSGGQPEAVLHEKTGLVVDGADPSSLIAALERLAASPAERTSMGRFGREWASTHGWDQVRDRTLAAINSVCPSLM